MVIEILNDMEDEREREEMEERRRERERREREEQKRRERREREEREEQERRERERKERERKKKEDDEMFTFICVLLMVSLFLGFLFGSTFFFFVYTIVVAFLSSSFIEDLCSRITDEAERVWAFFICSVLAYLLFSGTNVIKPFSSVIYKIL
jgi:cation transport ATPase